MIEIVIGQSGSGKTTLVKKQFIKKPIEIITGEFCTYSVSGKVALIGKYGVGIRTEGTDTLSYNVLPKILQQIDMLIKQYPMVVLEGDRINNQRFFNHLLIRGYPVKLTLVKCSLETSLTRLRSAGSKITPTFVKATKTKSLTNYLRFGSKFQQKEIVETG